MSDVATEGQTVQPMLSPVNLWQGVLNWTATDHFGYTPETGVLLKIVGGEWQVVH